MEQEKSHPLKYQLVPKTSHKNSDHTILNQLCQAFTRGKNRGKRGQYFTTLITFSRIRIRVRNNMAYGDS